MTGYGPDGLAREYSEKSDAYARLWAPVLRPMAEPLLDALPLAEAGRILDVGTGTGELLEPLRARAPGARIAGVDRAAGMLRLARGRGGAALLTADAARLPLQNGAFDVALLAFMLFHVSDPVAALREAARVLRPGGAVGVVTWGAHTDLPGLAIWADELEAAGAAPDPRDSSLTQQARMDTPEKLASLMGGAELDVVAAGAGVFDWRWPVEHVMEIHLGVGMPGRRIGSLPAGERAACRARVEDRLRGESGEAASYRPEVVWAIARSAP